MIKEMKQPSHVLGNRINCPNFAPCPICYGCRNYSTVNIDCEKCTKNRKRDICNTDLHKSDLIAKMVSRKKVEFDKEEQVNFISAKHKEE